MTDHKAALEAAKRIRKAVAEADIVEDADEVARALIRREEQLQEAIAAIESDAKDFLATSRANEWAVANAIARTLREKLGMQP